jgi:hypothetical protein
VPSGEPGSFHNTSARYEWSDEAFAGNVDLEEPDRKVMSWMIEGGPPIGLAHRDFTKSSLSAGIEIVVTGFRAKGNLNCAAGCDITFPDIRRLFVGSSTGVRDDRKDADKK